MGQPAWTEYELNLIRDTITDYREAGKQDQSALSALIKVMMHRNSKDVRNEFNRIRKEMSYGDTTIVHEVTDDEVVEMIAKIDRTIGFLEELQEEIRELRQSESDLTELVSMIHRVK